MESHEAAKNIVEIFVIEGFHCIQMGPLNLHSDMGLLQMPNDERPTKMLRYPPSNIPSSESSPSSMVAHAMKSLQVAFEETCIELTGLLV